MQLRICLLDETEYWNTEITNKVGKVFGVYLYDPNVHVHCAELTPSYEFYFLHSTVEKLPNDEDEKETILDSIEEADQSERGIVGYYHCNIIDRLLEIKPGETKAGTYSLGRYRRTKTIIDDVIEDYRCNPDY